MDSADTRRPYHRRKSPSFSSTLLESIYHSIDEPSVHKEYQHKSSSISSSSLFSDSTDVPSLSRAIMIDKWIENRSSSSRSSRHLNSSSSDSSYGGIFSSSESSVSSEKPKLSQTQAQARSCMFIRSDRSETPKHEGRFMRKTRSTAMKILKQPISPRIANFLNSLFNSRTVQRTKVTKVDESMEIDITAMRKSKSAKDIITTHRSCLSTKSNSNTNRLKRSVRFCPVSIIVDEQCRPCGQKSIYEQDMKNAHKIIGSNRYNYKEFKSNLHDVVDDDDDVDSCSSSDLFELENIGVFTEELPVYGTTNLKTNYAIANGLIKL